jgi:hypothetical protein
MPQKPPQIPGPMRDRVDVTYCRRELVQSHPAAWMIEVSGFIVDARNMSPEIQEEAATGAHSRYGARLNSSEWNQKGATLSDKTARKEYGLTQKEIEQAIKAGRLQCRWQAMHGNPFLRLLRSEVEKLVQKEHGKHHLSDLKSRKELKSIDRELKELRTRIEELEARRDEIRKT